MGLGVLGGWEVGFGGFEYIGLPNTRMSKPFAACGFDFRALGL